MSNDAYERIYYRGVLLNRRTVAALEAAEARMGRQVDAIPQGSYHSGTSQSAGTHDGGGAIDIYDHDHEQVEHAMRAVGFASWKRLALPGVWNEHVHSILIGDKEMSSGARSQVTDYYAGRDGLAGHGYDGHWKPSPIPVFDYSNHGDADSEWAKGDVYVSKLHLGQKNSESVKRLQYRLKVHKTAGTHKVEVDGDYGDQTRWAVRKWQVEIAKTGADNGLLVTGPQAHRLFGEDKYNVRDDAA